MVLIDTSAWIEFLRRGGDERVADEVGRLLDEAEAATCGVVEMELLQGCFPGKLAGSSPCFRPCTASNWTGRTASRRGTVSALCGKAASRRHRPTA